jgi:hypothetical protein
VTQAIASLLTCVLLGSPGAAVVCQLTCSAGAAHAAASREGHACHAVESDAGLRLSAVVDPCSDHGEVLAASTAVVNKTHLTLDRARLVPSSLFTRPTLASAAMRECDGRKLDLFDVPADTPLRI